jgi:hypothetical protein
MSSSSEQSDDDLIYDRFELVRELGTGGQATTWLARDLATDTDVALKELALERVVEWKSVELFEREGQALASIDHSRVPDYIDAFHIEDDEGRSRFFLAQEYVAGESLDERISSGLSMDVDEVAELLEDLLSVLAYLHDRSPPIIHRDIKPSNILIDEGGEPVLVDFGAVQLVLPNTVGGSTIVGTTGFFPMEQLMGKAVPASDLYAVGATIVHVMSGTHPAELEMERNRLQFEDVIDAPEWFESFLRRLLEPAAEDRFDDAAEALSFFRELRAKSRERDGGALAERDAHWLQKSAGRVLVDDRATPETVYRIDCPRVARLDDGVERKPGQVELSLQPERAVLEFRSGTATELMTPKSFGALVLFGVLFAIPLPPQARMLLLGLGIIVFAVYFLLRFQAQARHVEVHSDRIEVTDRGRTGRPEVFPRQSRFEARDAELLLKADDGRETVVASGLAPEQSEWLAAKMERARSELVEQKLIDIEPRS